MPYAKSHVMCTYSLHGLSKYNDITLTSFHITYFMLKPGGRRTDHGIEITVQIWLTIAGQGAKTPLFEECCLCK